jgi:hypothetical protein
MDVALDATGLAVRKYTPRWLTTHYAVRGRDFVKFHAAIELETQAFLSWEFTLSKTMEVTVGPALVDRITGKIANVFADAGYLSNRMCHTIRSRGATPYIRPRSTSKGRERADVYKPNQGVHETFLDMMDSYQRDKTAWLTIYHKRSRIESCFAAFKQRLRGSLAAMSQRMQHTELTLKIVAWNVTRVTRL